MQLKDLRKVVGEQTRSKIIVTSGDDSVSSGELWLFSTDDSIDSLEVVSVEPHDNVLVITLKCSPSTLHDGDWNSVFNQSAITSIVEEKSDILTQD